MPRDEQVISAAKEQLKLTADLIAEIYLRSKADQHAAQNELWFRRMFDDADIGMAMVAPSGRFLARIHHQGLRSRRVRSRARAGLSEIRS